MIDSSFKEYRIRGVDRSFWVSVNALLKTASKWWLSIWLLALLCGIIPFGLTLMNLVQVKPIVWISFLILGLVVAPIVSFHILRIERDEFKALWDDKEKVISILEEIESLRTEGVKLINEGNQFATDSDFKKWNQTVEQWIKSTYKQIYILHPAEAGNFYTLGLFKPEVSVGVSFFNDEHELAYKILSRKLRILVEIRDRWITRSN